MTSPSSIPSPEGPRDPQNRSVRDSAPQGTARDDDARGGPLTDEMAGTRDDRHRINPARLEVRVRRIALAGLVLVPLVYFIVQSLR